MSISRQPVAVPVECAPVECAPVEHQPVADTGRRQLPPGAGIAPHFHDEHQIVHASRGVLGVTTDAGSWIAPATRAIWIPAGTVHRHRAYGRTEMHTIGLPVSANPLRLSGPAVLEVSPLVAELLVACSASPPQPASLPADPAAARRLRAVLLDQLRASKQRPLYLPTPGDRALQAIDTAMRRDPAAPHSLAGCAAAVGVAPRTLSRLCRQDLGLTFPQWRTQIRLHLALRLLAERLPVGVVAARCGWNSTSAFIQVFRRTMGFTPGGRGR